METSAKPLIFFFSEQKKLSIAQEIISCWEGVQLDDLLDVYHFFSSIISGRGLPVTKKNSPHPVQSVTVSHYMEILLCLYTRKVNVPSR